MPILLQHLHIFGKRTVSRSKEGRHPLSAHCCILPDHDLRCLFRSSNEKAVEKKRKLSLLNQYGDLTKCACFCGEPIIFSVSLFFGGRVSCFAIFFYCFLFWLILFREAGYAQ